MVLRGLRALASVWVRVCAYDELETEQGVAALVKGKQVALFKLSDGSLRAVGNREPATGAKSIARGVVCQDDEGKPFVAVPQTRSRFNLDSGESDDDGSIKLPTFPVRVLDGIVEVCVPARVRRAPA